MTDVIHAPMIQGFRDQGTEDLFNGQGTRAARQMCPQDIWNVMRRKLDQLHSVPLLDDLRAPPGNRLEALKGDRAGQHSIRIDDQYRACFTWAEAGPTDVEIVDYH